jgi:hypothetical protein
MADSGVDPVKEITEKSVGFMEWSADQLRQGNWPTILAGLAVALLLFGNPPMIKHAANIVATADFLQAHPLPPDQSLYLYWGSALALLFLAAFVIIYRTRPAGSMDTGLPLTEGGAVKGLLSFSYRDAEVFEGLGRNFELRFCLGALCAQGFRFGVLQGESGSGKSSFLQAGVWPRLGECGFDAVYAQCTERPPLETIRDAVAKQLGLPVERIAGLDLAALLELAANTMQARDERPRKLILLLDQFEQFFTQGEVRKKDGTL